MTKYFHKKPALITFLILVIIINLKAIVQGSWGEIGTDSDDVMRLIQIRDFFAGQHWFDLTQYRMGPGVGTDMHWSRIVDLPMIILIGFFDIFLPYEWAEKIGISLWPPLCSGLVIWGVFTGVRHLGGKFSYIFAALLLGFLLVWHYRFAPGGIDHHNLQLALIAISIGHALDPQLRPKNYIISGVALALSVGIGMEVYAFVGIITGYMTVAWLIAGDKASNATQGFGLAFAITLAAIFITMISPKNYSVIHCDAFSLITLCAGAAGGIGLMFAAKLTSDKSFLWRFGSVVVLGLICLVILAAQAPQCLANPLDSLPADVKELWLGNIQEAQPLLSGQEDVPLIIAYALGPTSIAILVALRQIFRKNKIQQYSLLAVLIAVSLALSLYQSRFHVFSGIIALFILAPWIASIFEKENETEGTRLKYIGALALSLPYIWCFPVMLVMAAQDEDTSGNEEARKVCYSQNVFDVLSRLPEGRVVIASNGTPHVLKNTAHKTLSGNYHRNADGILSNIRIFMQGGDKSLELITAHSVDYLHVCRTTTETSEYTENNEHGLLSRLIDRDVPIFLEPIGEDLEDGAVTLYKVIKP